MDTTTPDMGDSETPDISDDTTETTASVDDLQAELAKWKAQSRKHEDRAKANAAAARELDELRAKHMTEQERAVHEARAEARREALAEASSKLVAAELRARAAGRMNAEQLEVLLGAVDTRTFTTDTGDVDVERVAAYIDGIAPAPIDTPPPTPGFPDLGQGNRGASNTALNGDPLLRDLTAKLGIKP